MGDIVSPPSTFPWDGRRSPFTIRGRSGEFFTSLTSVGVSADSMTTNFTLIPFLDQSRDGNFQGGVPLQPFALPLYNVPELGKVTIKIGTQWVGAVYDLDQQPQFDMSYTISFIQLKNGVTPTTITRSFDVNGDSHPANTYNNPIPFVHFYTEDVFPVVSGDDIYTYGDFKIVTVSLPPYYNP